MTLTPAKILIIGYGSQAKAWARNFRDSKVEAHIGLRTSSSSKELAIRDGFTVTNLEDDLSKYETYIFLTPDHTQIETLDSIASRVHKDAAFIYAHGWSYIRGIKDSYPQFSHLLLAPKAIASEVRFQYETKGKLGAAYSLEGSLNKDAHKTLIRELSSALGITAGPYKTSFSEETKADLFSEQTLLCSLLPYGALHSYNTLRSKGVTKEMAFMECWLEVKLIADAMVKLGPSKFFQLISPNALTGARKAQEVLFDKGYLEKLDSLFNDIETGKFYVECENTNQQQLREEVLEFWEKEELSKVFLELKDELIPGI